MEAISIGVGGLPGILSINNKYWLYFLLAMVVAIVIPFILTLIVGKAKLSGSERFGDRTEAEKTEEKVQVSETQPEGAVADGEEQCLKSILSGRVVPLEEVPDDVFSQHIMGDGLAVQPVDNMVVAPADAEVTVVMEDSRHACGLTLDNGMELLIHVGIDTVDMNGDGFELFVHEGDKVKCGDPLIRFSPEKIKAAGHPDITVFLVTDEGNASDIRYIDNIDAKAGETAVITFR